MRITNKLYFILKWFNEVKIEGLKTPIFTIRQVRIFIRPPRFCRKNRRPGRKALSVHIIEENIFYLETCSNGLL
jgi:hypothetical protein